MKNTIKKIVFATQIVLIALISFSSATAQAGALDPTFNASVFLHPTGSVQDTVLQPDGKIIVVGQFEIVNGSLLTNVARLNADGTVDATFNPPEIGGAGVIIYAAALQSDGKILVAGNFSFVSGSFSSPLIVRLNADGSLDNSFALAMSGGLAFGSAILDVVVLSDGKILIGGNFNYFPVGSNVNEVNIARLNPDGTTDTSFAAANTYQQVYDLEVQPDGKILGAVLLVGSNYFLKRLNPDGTEDPNFGALTGGTQHRAFAVQSDGKVLIGGFFSTVNNFPRSQIARVNADGTFDPTFTANTNSGGVYDIEIAADGKILVGGGFSTINGSPKTRIARLNADGTNDNTLNFINPTSPTEVKINTTYDILPLPDGGVIISGIGQRTPTQAGGVVIRLDQSGAIDTNFRVQIGSRGSVGKIAVQPDGKVLAAGVFSSASGGVRVALARFNADGSLDNGFDPLFVGGQSDPIVFSVAVQPDGKIIVGGQFGLIRRNADGSPDATFNTGIVSSFVRDVVVLPDGKIIAAGAFSTTSFNSTLARFNQDGSLDTTFNATAVVGAVRKIVVLPDGKLVVGGSIVSVSGFPRGRVARLNADGTADTSFNPLGGASDTVSDLDVQADGKVIIVGAFTNVNGVTRNYIARLNVDGSLDQMFNPSVNFTIAAVKIQPDGKIIIGGNFGLVSGVSRNGVARLNADGSLDQTFNVGGGTNGSVYTLALQPDNKVLVGGIFTLFNNTPKLGIVRLLNSTAAPRTRFDFDGDGRADVAVFRPSNGNWYQLRSANNSFNAVTFGQSNDLIAPADYDGDGKTDIAVWRGVVAGAGNFAYFYILNSSDNSFRPVQFGATGDVPVSGDWDGDGKADLAVYRDGSLMGGQSFFYYRPSSDASVNFRQIAWGGAGDKPLVGDFDGDGKLDAAVFRPSTAAWYILQSSNNQVIATNFGTSTDIPTPADFDGDGRANIAVFRPSSGTWFTSTNAANNYGAVQFGANGDVPVPADYDGDGKADVAVYRPSVGAWYLLRSTQGFTGVAFGDANDKPIPNAFIR